MFRICEIDHLVLRVRDPERMIHFYCSVLGCQVERAQPELGLTQIRAGRSLIDLITLDGKLGMEGGAGPGAEGRNVDHFCLRVEPWDEEFILEHLRKNSIAIVASGSRYGAQGEGPSVYCTDPEGNVVELKGPPWPEA